MNSLMQLLMDFTCTECLPRYLDACAYDDAENMESRQLAALKGELFEHQRSLLEKYRKAGEACRALELEAMFLAAYSVARELS